MEERENPYATPQEKSEGLRKQASKTYVILMMAPLYIITAVALVAFCIVAFRALMRFLYS